MTSLIRLEISEGLFDDVLDRGHGGRVTGLVEVRVHEPVL